MSTDLSLDQAVLEELDFPTSCGHSAHSEGSLWHGGDATYVAVSLHSCPATPDRAAPHYYPCCTVWADYVLTGTSLGRQVGCGRCGARGPWPDMVRIVSTL